MSSITIEVFFIIIMDVLNRKVPLYYNDVNMILYFQVFINFAKEQETSDGGGPGSDAADVQFKQSIYFLFFYV